MEEKIRYNICYFTTISVAASYVVTVVYTVSCMDRPIVKIDIWVRNERTSEKFRAWPWPLRSIKQQVRHQRDYGRVQIGRHTLSTASSFVASIMLPFVFNLPVMKAFWPSSF